MIADKPITDVTLEDIDERFASGSWAAAGGNMQSMLFAAKTLAYTPPELLQRIGSQLDATLIDYGCAEGDGTAMLAASFPLANVMGCDISSAAVFRARRRYPTLSFVIDDICNPTYKADCIWTSHTLEHVADPARAIMALRKRCNLLVAVVPPIETEIQHSNGSHVDAPFTSEWLKELTTPLFSGCFVIYRRDIPYDYTLLKEESLILIWEGI